MAEARNKILERMMERLFAGLLSGPGLNCRPHSSRQRVDFSQLEKFQDLVAEEALGHLLGGDKEIKLTARVAAPKRTKKPADKKSARGADKADNTCEAQPAEELSPAEKAAQQAWSEQQSFLAKLCILADEARTYEQDTGVHVLNVGFPLLSMPPGTFGASSARAGARRVLAPIAFIPVTIAIRSGATPSFTIACKSDGVDRVSPNTALLAWLEQQAGATPEDLYADETGDDPWREICELVRHVGKVLNLAVPEPFGDVPASPTGSASALDRLKLRPAPRADSDDGKPAIVPAAVLGLFPMNNQGLLRDMQAMAAGEALDGPVESFIRLDVRLDQPPDLPYDHEAWSGQKRTRNFAEERLVSASDPCQSRAVRLARDCSGLVIHGPPGTGKSQTITNIIGDHLARGERVLMVCDKRTALDVVANRLEHLGLGSLCALVHDPRHDQRDLYRVIRDQLETLTDARSDDRAEARLNKVDAELQRLHADLTDYSSQLQARDGADGLSFHELVGQWLDAASNTDMPLDAACLRGARLADFEQHEHALHDILTRAATIGPDNAWLRGAGAGLENFLARPVSAWRDALATCVQAARAADEADDADIPPFADQPELAVQGRARAELAARLQLLFDRMDQATRARWAKQNSAALRRARKKLTEAEPIAQILRAAPLDAELALFARDEKQSVADLAQQLGTLEDYLQVGERWFGLFCFQRRAQAGQVLRRYGLPPGPASCRRLRDFLVGLRARLVLQKLHFELLGQKEDKNENLLPEETLEQSLADHAALLDLLLHLENEPAVAELAAPVTKALAEKSRSTPLLSGLAKSAQRAEALTNLDKTLAAAGLFDAGWRANLLASLRAGSCSADRFDQLVEQFDSLESVLRLRQELAQLPAPLQAAVSQLLDSPRDADAALAALRRAALEAEITERLRGNDKLQAFDRQRLASSFQRYRRLDLEKKDLVRAVILHRWISRQKERVLVGTASRLNGVGADLRRRLTMRGERALRLRQVVAVGQGIEGGDPLFDLRPVWMASPQTVAQIFARQPLFDVVIFDEASQCRLEEALPVLTRARRVVIAGDPKQLPPTRFFESAVTVSEDEVVETDQQLFEAHQGEIEDLLGAALSIDIQQSYLDVHYRSRNADLIEFSNQQFYSARLQPIPGHPRHRVRFAPITLYRAGGIYEDRTNAKEAEEVCKIVRDLLKRAEPPSIGIACFNLAQRDLIVERLEELAGEDGEFAARLGESRGRHGNGSFEGLFVKNLENVQGDERDHMIISTTYGPDPQGRFYRRFGPLGKAGGGRRLNVLITRAREEVHLVTSIPPEVYRNLPPVPTGQAPGGGWLLFAYLAHAEHLARAYEEAHQILAEAETSRQVHVHERPSQTPSLFARALARQLADRHQVGSDIHWGNDGFCVDLALHHPEHLEDVTLGILCDGARFSQAEDPVEWDVFRTAVLESQGWRLHRLWTPHFFRDPAAGTQAILQEVQDLLAREDQKDAIKVTKKTRA